jgi:hypothetical protein
MSESLGSWNSTIVRNCKITSKRNLSETGYYRLHEKGDTLLGPLEGATLTSLDQISGRLTKSRNPVTLSVIRHHQGTLESIQTLLVYNAIRSTSRPVTPYHENYIIYNLLIMITVFIVLKRGGGRPRYFSFTPQKTLTKIKVAHA